MSGNSSDITYPQYIWVEFYVPKRIVSFSFASNHNGWKTIVDGPTKYEFFYSDGDCKDQSTWVTLYTDDSGDEFTYVMERWDQRGSSFKQADIADVGDFQKVLISLLIF